MIEPTDELKTAVAEVVNTAMRQAARPNASYSPPHWHRVKQGSTEDILTAVLAIVERDYDVLARPTPEQLAALPKPRRRLRTCVENWPGAEIEGDYDPRCCRFPKSCSASVYDDDQVTDDDLEPEYRS